jgi:iron complex outermembrane receptor protein
VHGSYISYRHAFGTRLLLTSGGRYDHSYTNASRANSALYQAYHATSATTAHDSGVSGNIKLSWQATASTSLFAGVGSNIRFADPEERFFHSDSSMGNGWVGNPLLTHPRNTEYDLGLTAKKSRYTLSPLFFFSDLSNYITLYAANRQQTVAGVSSTKAQSYANVQAHQWGGELTSSAPIAKGLRADETFAYTRGTKVPQPGNNIFSSNLFQVPPIRSTLDLRYERPNLYAAVSAIVTGRQDHVDTDENELRTAGYSTFNLKLGYHTNRIRVEGGVNNLLAREYSDFLSYARNPYTNGVRLPEPGRNFFVNLSYTLASRKR